jgi:hypothetical protein
VIKNQQQIRILLVSCLRLSRTGLKVLQKSCFTGLIFVPDLVRGILMLLPISMRSAEIDSFELGQQVSLWLATVSWFVKSRSDSGAVSLFWLRLCSPPSFSLERLNSLIPCFLFEAVVASLWRSSPSVINTCILLYVLCYFFTGVNNSDVFSFL